ncbi:MAG TPA: fatty acid--CoA ligase family protein [Conexibacter sp.]|nr:fatty acid--CoA ligase family protein [Conexibacter sp.]
MSVVLHDRLAARGDAPALVAADRTVSYAQLCEAIGAAHAVLDRERVARGAVTGLVGDFGRAAIAMQLALFERGCAVVPLRAQDAARHASLAALAQVEQLVVCSDDAGGDALVRPAGGAVSRPAGDAVVRSTGDAAHHVLYERLRGDGHAGLVLFSSGTGGAPKAALHDMDRMLAKYEVPRAPARLLAFLLFDHIGGVNTLLHALLHGGCLVTVADRAPDTVAAAIARHRVEVLPASPTFLNLLLLSGALERHDLSSLRVVSYGTEPMSPATLDAFHRRLPGVKLHQTYGMTELGILASRSRGSDSLWMRLDADACDHRVRDGLLEVRTRGVMLGYLNAAGGAADDGWFATGDAVEVDGEWIRVLGRPSELINVGGLKVVPAEVEGVLEAMPEVRQAVVSGEPSPVTGQLVRATVWLAEQQTVPAFRARMRAHCRERLARHMVPQKVVLSDGPLHGARQKKQRIPGTGG